MSRIKEEDYAYATALIRAKEMKLMNQGKLERLLDAADSSDAIKILVESGYGSDHIDYGKEETGNIEALLSTELKKACDMLSEIIPDPKVIELFLYQYDYLNAKLILKAEFVGIDVKNDLSSLGTIQPDKLFKFIAERNFSELPEILGRAITDSIDSFNQAGDPQEIDFIMDKACYENMLAEAMQISEPFLVEFVKRMIDIANIRIFIRAKLLSKPAIIRKAAIPEGSIPESTFEMLAERNLDQFFEALKSTGYAELSPKLAAAVKHPSGISEIEKTLDDSINLFLKGSKYLIMGIEPVIAYLFFKDTEIKNARLILTGKANKISQETIKERLRLGYA
jgi:V/A-type H+-transporting ATPase subunit C